MLGAVGKPACFEGYAEDHDRQIRAVQFSLDGGASWTTYPTAGASSERLVHWRFSYTPQAPGRYELLVRSVNECGKASPVPASIVFEVA